jgi:antitoxin MazE
LDIRPAKDVAAFLINAYNVITGADMRVNLARVGNSRGVRIPKAWIEECGFRETVEMEMKNGRLVISPYRPPRNGWDDAFRAAKSTRREKLLLDLGPSSFDCEEWRW